MQKQQLLYQMRNLNIIFNYKPEKRVAFFIPKGNKKKNQISCPENIEIVEEENETPQNKQAM